MSKREDTLAFLLGILNAPRPDDRRPQPLDLPDRMWSWPVRSALRPLPPKVPADVGPLELARSAANAYAGAYRADTGKSYRPFVRLSLARNPHYGALLAAARLFAVEDIRPARWVLWSIDRWREIGRDGMPPPGFVFSAKTLAEKRGWFWAEQAGYAGRQDITVPLELELGARWLAMRRAVTLRAPGETGASIAERWFPGDSWERAVEAAQAEVTSMQADLDRRCAAGEWLWR